MNKFTNCSPPCNLISMSCGCNEAPPPLLIQGVAQFNRGEFFEQHETLETLWRTESRDVRYLYQGILQIGIAVYQVKRRNHHGAVYMLTRGTHHLRPFTPQCQSVDVKDLLVQAAHLLDAVRQLGPNGLSRFDWSRTPHVRLVNTGQRI